MSVRIVLSFMLVDPVVTSGWSELVLARSLEGRSKSIYARFAKFDAALSGINPPLSKSEAELPTRRVLARVT